MLKHPTLDQLYVLGLQGMAKGFTEIGAEAENLDKREWLGLLLDREASWRQDKRFAARLRYAKLRQQACAEDVDYRSPRGLDRPLFQKLVEGAGGDQVVPAIIAGDKAARRYLEFFAVTIENANTRAAYFHACRRFFAWCEQKGIDELVAIEPMHVAAYIRALGKDFEKPTVKQHLAAIRMLFDWLVVGQVVAINPAHAVRGPKYAVKRGKTSVLTPDEARKLLDSIDVTTLVGLRDRALIGIMAYSFARVSAVVSMRVEDYFSAGKRWWVRLHEKGGKRHEMPCHHMISGPYRFIESGEGLVHLEFFSSPGWTLCGFGVRTGRQRRRAARPYPLRQGAVSGNRQPGCQLPAQRRDRPPLQAIEVEDLPEQQQQLE